MNKELKEALTAHMKKLASNGGKNTVKKHGTKYMSDLAKKSWEDRRKAQNEEVDKSA